MGTQVMGTQVMEIQVIGTQVMEIQVIGTQEVGMLVTIAQAFSIPKKKSL